MVLVDTSVWIRFLGGREPYASALQELLGREQVLAHDLVEGELVIGASARRGDLLAAYAAIDRAAVVPHAEVVEFVRNHGLHGRGIGWIDAHLLASTLVKRCRLWTADGNLAGLADALGIGHAPGR